MMLYALVEWSFVVVVVVAVVVVVVVVVDARTHAHCSKQYQFYPEVWQMQRLSAVKVRTSE
jgi:hypothetical protein